MTERSPTSGAVSEPRAGRLGVVLVAVLAISAGFGARTTWRVATETKIFVVDLADGAEAPFDYRPVVGAAARAEALRSAPPGRRLRAVHPRFGAVPETLATAPADAVFVFAVGVGHSNLFDAYALMSVLAPRTTLRWLAKSDVAAMTIMQAVEEGAEFRGSTGIPAPRPLYLVEIGEPLFTLQASAAERVAAGPHGALWRIKG